MKPAYKLILSSFNLLFWVFLYLNFNQLTQALSMDLSPSLSELVKAICHAVIWLALAHFLCQLINQFFQARIFTLNNDKQVPKLLRDILFIFIYIAALLIIVGHVFKQPLTGFWATSSVTALVLGFALRNIILDLFSGIAVNLEQPYRVGDWIKIDQRLSTDPIIGTIIDINWRSTYIKTEANRVIVVPNSFITTQAVITNYEREGNDNRFEVKFTLDYSVPVSRATRVLLAGVMESSENKGFVKENKPQVLVDETNEMGVVYIVRYWIYPWHDISPSKARSQVQTTILNHLDAAGLTLAYPKEDVYHTAMPARHLAIDNAVDRVKLMRKLDIFSFLTDDEIKTLSSQLIRKEIPQASSIVKEDDEGRSMFVLLEGLLDVEIINGQNEPVKVAQINPGSYFGEMSLLTGEKRSASITSVTESVVFEITRDSINQLMSGRENFIEKISENIASRKAANEKALTDSYETTQNNTTVFKEKLIHSIKSLFQIA